MVPGSAAALAAEKAGRQTGRETLDVKMWSSMEATPYGHFNKVMQKPIAAIPGPPYSTTGLRVLGDHYTRH